MFPLSQGATFNVQQEADGFDGSLYGRARTVLNVGGSEINVSRRLWGNEGPYRIQLVDTGAPQTRTEATLAGFDMTVRLRRTGVLQATAEEVATAIREYENGPFLAHAPNGSLIVAAEAWNPLMDGIGWGDPVVGLPCFRLPAMPNRYEIVFDPKRLGGGLDFENWHEDDVLVIRSFHLTFPTVLEILRVEAWIANLDLNGDAPGSFLSPPPPPPTPPMVPGGIDSRFLMELVSPERPMISLPDLKVPLLPFQRLVVQTRPLVPGTLKVGVRREARFPYL